MKVVVHGYHAGKAWLCICVGSGTSIFKILGPPLVCQVDSMFHM